MSAKDSSLSGSQPQSPGGGQVVRPEAALAMKAASIDEPLDSHYDHHHHHPLALNPAPLDELPATANKDDNRINQLLMAGVVASAEYHGGNGGGTRDGGGRDAGSYVGGRGGVIDGGGRSTSPLRERPVSTERAKGDRSDVSSSTDISSFSPYAARLSTWRGEHSLEDCLSRATSKMARLRVEDGEDHEALLSPAKENQDDKHDGSAHDTLSVSRRMEFGNEAEEPSGAGVGSPLKALIADASGGPVSVSPEPMSEDIANASERGDGDVVGGGEEELDGGTERTLLVYPKECRLHMRGEGYDNHQECPMRLELLCGREGALWREPFRDLEWVDSDSIKPAVITDLLRVHEYDYLQHIQERCRNATPAVPSTSLPSNSGEQSDQFDKRSPSGAKCSPPSAGQQKHRTLESGTEPRSSSSYSCNTDKSCDGFGRESSEETENVASFVLPRGPLDSRPASDTNGSGTWPSISHSVMSDDFKASAESLMVSQSTGTSKGIVSTAASEVSPEEEGAGAGISGEFGQRFAPDPGYVDVDTRVSRESYMAARMAAGAVICAVDRVLQGKNPNAFVAVRPPGHHAGPCGSVPSSSFWKQPGMNSSGFCLINNAAVGAAYARSRYGKTGEVSRVAIVDIDIHHGNGTEEIVRCVRPVTTRLPLPPSWPPMTKTIYKPWLDDEDFQNVFFGSVSLQDKGTFYPASGTEEENFDGNRNIVNVSLSPLGPPPGEEAKKRALTKTKLQEYVNKARAEFKTKCSKMLLPRLKEFSPDLLIISAGFDGHVEDYYHYLSNDCYFWITQELAGCCPSRRVVSVLEGGYSLAARPSKSKAARPERANNKRGGSKSQVSADKAAPADTAPSVTSSSSRILRERRTRPSTRGNGAPPPSNASSSSSSSAPSDTKFDGRLATTVISSRRDPKVAAVVENSSPLNSTSNVGVVGGGVSYAAAAGAGLRTEAGPTGDELAGSEYPCAEGVAVDAAGANSRTATGVAAAPGQGVFGKEQCGTASEQQGPVSGQYDSLYAPVATVNAHVMDIGGASRQMASADISLQVASAQQQSPTPPRREEEKNKRPQKSRKTKVQPEGHVSMEHELMELLGPNDGGLVSGVISHVIALVMLAGKTEE